MAFLVAVGAAEQGRPTLMFLSKEAVRLAVPGVAVGTACDGCPALPDLTARYEKAGGRYFACPICFNARQLGQHHLLPNAELNGTVPMWQRIGDDGATSFPNALIATDVPELVRAHVLIRVVAGRCSSHVRVITA